MQGLWKDHLHTRLTLAEIMALLVSTKNRDLWEGTTPEVRDSRTSRHSAHEQSQVWKIRLAETTSKRILCACLENRTRGPFLEAPGNYRARKAVLFFIADGSCKSFENYTIKILAKETKRTSLEVRTHPSLPETLTSKYDFGPVKLPELSRNGPLIRGRDSWC